MAADDEPGGGGKVSPRQAFYVAVATAGLEEGAINESTTFEDTGEIRVGDYSYKNGCGQKEEQPMGWWI